MAEGSKRVQRLSSERAVQILKELLETADSVEGARLGRNDRASVVGLQALFQEHGEVSLHLVLARLWPGRREEAAASLYRSFKERLNARFLALNRSVRLDHPRDNRPTAEKTVWLEETLSEAGARKLALEEAAPVLASRIEREQRRTYADTPMLEYVEQLVTAQLPLVSFAETLSRFAEDVASPHWQTLSEEDRAFLTHLGTRLQPIPEEQPSAALPRIMATKCRCEPLGPNGESLAAITRAMPRVDPALLGALLALSAAKTAQALRLDAAGPEGGHGLVFVIPLAPEFRSSPYLEAFLSGYRHVWEPNVLFEVEDPASGCVLQGKPVLVQELDENAARELSGQAPLWGAGIGEYRLVPFGAIHPDASPLTTTLPHVADATAILDRSWDVWLADLGEFGLPDGRILASRLLAEVTQIVDDFLTEEERFRVRRRRAGPVYRLELPGSAVGREAPLVLAVVSERAVLRTLSSEHLAGADYLLVGERVARLPGEQILLEALPSLLRSRRKLPGLGREALGKASLQEHYPLDQFVRPDVGELREHGPANRAEGNDSAGLVATEGRQLLFDWLISPGAPFCVLLGDYGMGKTFLCRVFTSDVLERRQLHPDLPVPLYLDLRDLPTWKGDRLPELEEMIETLCRRAGFPDVSAEAVLAAVRLGHVALIFDGFDEKAAHLTDAESTALLNEIRRAVPAGAKGKVLITCRTHYFEDRPNERAKVGGGALSRTRAGRLPADFRIVYLQPFDKKRILQYLHLLFQDKADDVFAFLEQVHDLMDLAKRPYLLFLLTQHLAELETLAAGGERVGAASIYQAVVEEWMRRDEGKHAIPTNIKVALMEELARRMWVEGRKEIHFAELRGWLQEQMRERLPAVTLADAMHADADLRTATFLSRDPEGNYRFAHTSFQEFFLARHIAGRLSGGHLETLAMPRFSPEVVAFVIDLLHSRRYAADRAALSLQQVLEQHYTQGVSENALVTSVTWSALRPESAPTPTAYQLQGADLAGADLAQVDLDPVDLFGADLSRAQLTEARLRGSLRQVDLSEVRGAGADLEGCDLREAVLDGADLAGACLVDVDLSGARATSAFFQRADLTGAGIDGTEFTWTRFAWARLSEAQAARAILRECSFPPPPALTRPALPQTFRANVLTGHEGEISGLAFSPDGKAVATGSSDGTVKLWETATGMCISTLPGPGAPVLSVAFSPDGRTLASGGASGLPKLWDASTGQPLRTLPGDPDDVCALAFDPMGTLLASGHERTIRLWEVATGDCRGTFEGHQDAVTSLAFSPDGTLLASASDDGTARIWEVSTGRCLSTHKGHSYCVTSLAFSPDGLLASGSSDGTARLWVPRSERCLRTLRGHEGPVCGVAFSPDGKVVATGSQDRTVKVWEATTGRNLRTLRGHEDYVTRVAFSPDGMALASGGDDGSIRFWNLKTGHCTRTLRGQVSAVRSVAFRPDGTAIAAGGNDETARVHKAVPGSGLNEVQRHDAAVLSVAYSPDGKILATAGDNGIVKLCAQPDGRWLHTLRGHEGVVFSVAFSADGQTLASGGDDGTVRVWATTGCCRHTLQGHEGVVFSVAFASTGETLASGGSDGSLRIWEAMSGQCRYALPTNQGMITSVAFSPDGTLIATAGSDGSVRVWELVSGHCRHLLRDHEGMITGVAFSPNGTQIASADTSGVVKLWGSRTGCCLYTLCGHEGVVFSVAFNPSGNVLASGGNDGTVRVWETATGQLRVSLWGWSDGEWLTLGPDETFEGSPGGMQRLTFIDGPCGYPAGEFLEALHRPGLLRAALA